MNKSTIIEEMQKIRRLRIMGITHDQIKKRLKLSDAQYAKRVANINKIDKEYIENEFHEELGSEIVNMKGRIESVIQMCDRIMTNDEADPFARLDAGRLTIHCSIGLVKLYSEGPKMLGSHLTNAIISGKQKLESRYTDREPGPIVRLIDNNDAANSEGSETETSSQNNDSSKYHV